MSKALQNLKEELERTADWNVTVTVSRKDLEYLIRAYENLKQERKNERPN